jgi:hypothetical protein
MRDCNQFPCENFRTGPYPFSQGFLNMQARRLKIRPPAFAPDGSRVNVASDYWDELQTKDFTSLCNLTLFNPFSSGSLLFQFLQEEVVVDIENRCLRRLVEDDWVKSDDPLLELVTVHYLLNVKEIYPMDQDIVGVNDLKESHFFQGPHVLKTDPLLERYGHDLDGFKQAAEYLKGSARDMADAAYRLLPFPRVPLYFLLWKGDEEFKARMTVLFDRNIEKILAADAIWAMVNRVSTALLEGPDN